MGGESGKWIPIEAYKREVDYILVLSRQRDKLRAQRDELLTAAESMIGYFEEQPHGTIDRLSQCSFMLRAAITRAKEDK